MNHWPIFVVPIFQILLAICLAAPSEKSDKSVHKLDTISVEVDDLSETLDRLGLKHYEMESEKEEKNVKIKNKNAKRENKTKQKKGKCKKSGILHQIGALAMIPLLIAGIKSSPTLSNSSDSNFSSLQIPFFGATNALQISNIHRNLSAEDEAMNDRFCVIQLSVEDKVKSENEETNTDDKTLMGKERTAEMRGKIKMVQKKWQNEANATIDFGNIFKKFGTINNEEKLSLLEELSQRAIGAKSRCDDQILLRDYGTVEKIGTSFFSVDRSYMIEDKHIKNYNANSEHFGACVAIVEIDTENMRGYIKEKLRNEMQILKKLSRDSEHMLRMLESEQNGNTFKMVTEIVRLDFWEVWYQSDAEKSANTRQILYNEMLRALEEFHKNGMHLNINLTKFYFVEHKNDNGIANGDDDESTVVIMDIEGQKLKLKTKLADFGSAILFSGVPPNINMATDYDSVYGHGTPAFMCPEQISGAFALTPKCDIFSLGISLYEMLVPQQIVHQKLPILVAENETQYLWTIAMASLQKNPNWRPNAKGIRKYLRGECRLHVGHDEFGINDDVPMAKCDTE